MTSSKTDNTKQAKPQPARQTIGLLTYGAGMPLNDTVWAGVADAAREQDINLICLPGKPLHSPIDFDFQANVLYHLVSPERVDGLVIWGGALAHHTSSEAVQAFCQRYRPLPMINVSIQLEGIPSLLADNYQGMREAVIHLIETHGYRRIAFIRGPEGQSEAEERYRGYVDVLAEYNIPLDPGLVAPGEFKKSSGVAAIDLLLDERKLDFEAVVAAADPTAIGAMETLQARGIRVPGQVVVVGFDDAEEARFITPPLTTVQQPIYELGKQATEMLLALMAGEQIPEQVILPTRLVARQSCGCLAPSVLQAAVGPVAGTSETFAVAFATRREEILSEMAQAVESPVTDLIPGRAEQLLDAFAAEWRGESPGVFLSTLEEVLRQVTAVGDRVSTWQRALSVLRRHTLPYLGDEVLSWTEDLWQQARVVIGDTARRVQAYRRLQAEERVRSLNKISRALITTFDVTKLMNVAAQGLPGLGIKSAYISLYDDPKTPTGWSRLILAYDRQGRVSLEAGGQRFPSRQLVPDGLLSQDRQYSIVVEPLYFQEEQLGLAVFEANPREAIVYDVLRGQFSSSLKGALLLQERERAEKALEKAYAEVEKQVEERTAELQQEIIERRRTEEALRESEATLESIFRTVPLGIGLVRDRRLDWSNDRMREITGYSPEMLLGANPQILYESKEEFMRVGTILYEGMSKRGIGEVETRWKRKDGSAFDCLIRATPLDPSKPLAGFISAALDITARKRAEEGIRQRTAQLEALREVGLELTSQLDLDVLLRSIVARAVELLDANSGGFSIYRPGQDLLEWSLAFDPNLVSDGGLIPWGEGLAGRVWETGRPLIVNDYKRWEGRLAAFENYGFSAVMGVPVRWGDEFFGVLEVMSRPPHTFSPAHAELLSLLATQAAIAIRNARLYEEIKELHWQSRLDAETKAILLDEVNHRAKNNLTAIIGLLIVEKRHAQEEKLASHQTILEDMINRIRGLATAHSLLSASEWAPLPLSELASQVIHSALQVLPSDKDVSVKVSPSPIRVASKLANSLALVINELTTNTIKYALPEHHTTRIIVHIALEDDRVLFEFRDDGPGYPEEVLRLERHHVGLYLVQNIVREQLQGESTFHNDQGAVTTIRFPAAAGD